MKTLILGGYGNFGARIARALSGDPALAVLVGGRDGARASDFARTLRGHAQGVAVDTTSPDLPRLLQRLGVGLVIHTAGPFQQQSYAVAAAAAAAGAHYIDLADGRRFVCDLPAQMDPAFRAAGRSAVTGASTVPALSSAVVDHLCAGWRHIRSIDICIAPAQTAPRGLATMEAVLGYCGRPIEVWSGGRWCTQYGWAQPTRAEFLHLKPRWGALCDIPDLELFPARYQVSERVMFRAALEVRAGQHGLAMLSWLARRRVVRRPQRWAGAFNRAAAWLDRFGSALGGMFVQVAGTDMHGRDLRRTWHIAADHDHGPEIPCMAAILLARAIAKGEPPPIGARSCTGLLTLAQFEPEFRRWGMVTDVVDEASAHASAA
ncbi:MAG: saccharopine dehydrogenase NADP-binding domain-containing protein [Pseudomonadota bacterium]